MNLSTNPAALRALTALERHSAKRRHVIQVNGRRTSLNLEDAYWGVLRRIARDEGLSVAELISLINRSKPAGTSLTAAVRLYILTYIGLASG